MRYINILSSVMKELEFICQHFLEHYRFKILNAITYIILYKRKFINEFTVSLQRDYNIYIL